MSERTHYYRLNDEIIYDESRIIAEVQVFTLVRRTRKGAWIRPSHLLVRKQGGPFPLRGKDRFVLDGPGRRYAYDTMEAAIESFEIRKRRQVQHLERQLERARAALSMVTSPGFEPLVPHHDPSLSGWISY